MMAIQEAEDAYPKEYRKKLGFTNQGDAKDFFGAKDIIPSIDFGYMDLLNERLYEMADRMNEVVAKELRSGTPTVFKKEFIDRPFSIMKKNGILPKLNNLGRRPESVYFNWMRGYVVQSFFSKAIDFIFDVDTRRKILIGDDDFKKLETFKKTPKADLELQLNSGEKLRIEIQAGFTGTNDIKKHKVTEAERVFKSLGMHTIAVHFDLYNGQAAFVKLDGIDEKDTNWEHRQQMEGQVVFAISWKHFLWKMIEPPIKYKNMNL